MEVIKKYSHVIWYSTAIILFIFTIIYLVKANDFMRQGGFISAAYFKCYLVGGDAYNYIIGGTYSTTLTVRALIFSVLSVGSLIMGGISSLKK